MKQLLFLLLFPCLALAQYTGNAGQKITLGEQTTADGLVYRGVANDTNVITPFSDTSAYIILDTVDSKFYHYNRTTTYWALAGGDVSVSSFSAGTTGLTPSTATTGAVTLGGTLAVANGGTGSATQNFVDLTTNQIIGGIKNFTGRWQGVEIGVTRNGSDVVGSGPWIRLTNTAEDRQMLTQLNAANGLAIWSFDGSNWNTIYTLTQSGNVGIGTTTPQSGYRLHVVDSVYVGGNVSASAYTTRSDYDLKDEIQNISYGINEVMQMQPVKYTYKSNGSTQLGFIAQDLGVITPEVVSFEDKMSVYYNALIPILTKAIQEQQALIKALEQRINNLENK